MSELQETDFQSIELSQDALLFAGDLTITVTSKRGYASKAVRYSHMFYVKTQLHIGNK